MPEAEQLGEKRRPSRSQTSAARSSSMKLGNGGDPAAGAPASQRRLAKPFLRRQGYWNITSLAALVSGL